MINWDFCFYQQTGWVCLVLVRANWLHAIPKIVIPMAKPEQQTEPWHSREVQDPIWPSLFSQRRIPNPRAPLGIVPKWSQRCEGPQGGRCETGGGCGSSRPWGPGRAWKRPERATKHPHGAASAAAGPQ